ncbi:protein of unknown function [Halopseudomonas litoralis]|uniref:FecR N-terminal domain-containing protein n=1 Tax=Halopseudomonas litoralis TaxID=797277 RepID=A0A1H1Q4R1_9GAMM|nr:DUF4880 domain-containing protein [Halopseudomonas litoralis]SDS18400.1 protein of unknown function [Halopseudomonas litoralis]
MARYEHRNAATPATETQLRDQALRWLVRLTSGHVSATDANAFRRWCALSEEHRRAFALVKRVWDALGQFGGQGAPSESSNIIPIISRRIKNSRKT